MKLARFTVVGSTAIGVVQGIWWWRLRRCCPMHHRQFLVQTFSYSAVGFAAIVIAMFAAASAYRIGVSQRAGGLVGEGA